MIEFELPDFTEITEDGQFHTSLTQTLKCYVVSIKRFLINVD